MLIVEGPDGAGKTTLIEELKGQLDIEVMPKAASSDTGPDTRTLRNWVDMDLSSPNHAPHIYDRYPLISEPIYGPLIRGRMAYGFADLQWFASRCAMIRERSTAIIFCLPPYGVVNRNVVMNHNLDTKHQRGVRMRIQAIYEQYIVRCALEAQAGTSVFVWDYTREDTTLDFKDIIEIVERYS